MKSIILCSPSPGTCGCEGKTVKHKTTNIVAGEDYANTAPVGVVGDVEVDVVLKVLVETMHELCPRSDAIGVESRSC